jgi:hypothetical protein
LGSPAEFLRTAVATDQANRTVGTPRFVEDGNKSADILHGENYLQKNIGMEKAKYQTKKT